MKDRYKFRMFDKNTSKMYSPENIEENESIYKCLHCQVKWDFDFDTEIKFNHIADGRVFMQCTALKDKNGKLIYEGDIIYKKGNKDHKGNKMFSSVIRNDMYAEFNISDKNGLHRMPSNSSNIEIIGNIYENLELLKA